MRPDEALVRAVSIVESGNNPEAVGDSGRAVGPFQFWEIAWRDVSENYREPRGLAVWPYSKASNLGASKVYAVNFFDLQRIRFIKSAGREPSVRDLYALFNLGFEGYRRRGFNLERCPKITQRAAVKVEQLRAKILRTEGK
jgi:hypothetical protein